MDKEISFYQEIERTGRVVYTTRGFSMMPLLRQKKDVVVIEKPKEHCKKYDTVLFLRTNGQYVLHRILKIVDGQYWIVGDNCFTGEIVKNEQIIGVLTSIRRGKRTIKVTDWHYRLYTHIWCDVYPLRFLYLRIRFFIARCYRYLKRKVFG